MRIKTGLAGVTSAASSPETITPDPLEPQDFYRGSASDLKPGPWTDWAQQASASWQDLDQARAILAQARAFRSLTDQKIQAMLADLQTTVFALWAGVMQRRQKACQTAFDQWSKLMMD